MKQMWRCGECGAIRQWGTATLVCAQKAARESGETLIVTPQLTCGKCAATTPHSHHLDVFETLDVLPSALPPSRPVEPLP